MSRAWWILVGVVQLPALPLPGQNLLVNPSFEKMEQRGGDSLPCGWDAWSYEGTTLRWANTRARSGSGSGYIEVGPAGATQFPLFCQRFKVRPGERYRARIWTCTEGVVSSWGPQLNFEFLDAAGRRMPFVEGGQAGGGSRDWTELTLEAYVPDGASEMLFAAFLHREGKVWLDDAELIKVSDPEHFTGSQVTVRVQPDLVVTRDFLGFGNHGDNFLNVVCNTRHDVTDEDRQLVRDRVTAMRPKLMRLLFDYKWWEPEKGIRDLDNDYHRGMIAWIEFLGSIDCDVIIHPWGDHFAYSRWMLPDDPQWWTHPESRLPVPAQRDAMVRSLVDFLVYLRREKGLGNVKYVCLMNEPENDHRRPTPPEEYIRLTRLLADCLKQCGLDQEIMLLGPDDCTAQHNGASLWWRQTMPGVIDVLDGFSSHTYRHRDTRMLKAWIGDRIEHARQLEPERPDRPMMVTEFGYVGLEGGTFENPENTTYEYGLFMGDFAIEILNSGAAAALNWCLFDQFYDDAHCQRYGLWEFQDQGWRPRPAFYTWSLICRYSDAHSRVVQVEVEPAVQQLRAAAVIAPDGKMTLMVINRYDREMQVTLHPGLAKPTKFRLFRYTQDAVQAATGDMLSCCDELTAGAQQPIQLPMPAQSFAVLTE